MYMGMFINHSTFFVKDLKGTLAQELDFENEGRNGERCAQELQKFPFVYVPKIHWTQTSKVRNFMLNSFQNIVLPI